MSPNNFNRDIMKIAPFIGTYHCSSIFNHLPEIPLAPTITGTLSFAATLTLSTFLQAKLFRVSTGTVKPIPSILGLGSVAVASIVCHVTSIQTYQASGPGSDIFDWFYSPLKISTTSYFQKGHASLFDQFSSSSRLLNDIDVSHSLRVIAFGLIAYKGLGGRFWSVSPSSLTNLGSFARRVNSLPATDSYATESQRKMIGKLGRLWGCHTCGDHMIFKQGLRSGTKFIADHMPPQAVVKQMEQRWYRKLLGIKVQQRFYPQCVNCSLRQSNILSGATKKVLAANQKSVFFKRVPNLAQSGGGSNAYIHGFKLRREHLAGGLLAAATVGESSELDVLNGNRIRFREWQLQAEYILHTAWKFMTEKF